MYRSRDCLVILATLAVLPGCRPGRESAEQAVLRVGEAVANLDFEAALAFRRPRSESNLSASHLSTLARALDLTLDRRSLAAAPSAAEDRESIRVTLGPDGKQREISRTKIDLDKATRRLIDLSGRFDNGTPFTVTLNVAAGEDGWKTDVLHLLIQLARVRIPDQKARAASWLQALEAAKLDRLVMDDGYEYPLETLRAQAEGTLPAEPEGQRPSE